MSDLEDDMNEYGAADAGKASLFDENDEDDYQPGLEDEGLEDDIPDEEDAGPAQELEPAAPTAEDRKAIMARLVAKKKREAEGPASGDDEEGGSGRRRKTGSGDKKDKKKRKAEGPSEGRGRPQRGAAGAGEGEEGGDLADIPDFEAPEDDVETAADRGFIDNSGDEEEEEENVGSDVVEDEYEDIPPPEEAEEGEPEADEAEFGAKKRRKQKESEAQMAMVVDDKLAKMEAAAEEDMEQHEAGRPAVQKLKMLKEADDFLAQKKYHEMFISAGGLGVLKAWLEPYSDGSLPNVKVRGCVLRACKNLPIDTHREDIKSQLKKSQLGSRVMFLAKCPDEAVPNKNLARELVQRWSRPIFFDADSEAEKRRVKEEQLRGARANSLMLSNQKDADAKLASQKPKPKLGQAGFRWHAAIPQASKLDYVVEPQKDERLVAAAGAHEKKETSRFDKKMREVTRKQAGKTARAAVPSVEGRNIVILN
eukprot:gene21242-28158_t